MFMPCQVVVFRVNALPLRRLRAPGPRGMLRYFSKSKERGLKLMKLEVVLLSGPLLLVRDDFMFCTQYWFVEGLVQQTADWKGDMRKRLSYILFK